MFLCHLPLMEQQSNTQNVMLGNLKGRSSLKDLDVDGRIILILLRVRNGFRWLEQLRQ
jgi:hypothetical protein